MTVDRYDFMSVVDDIFKECKNEDELLSRYNQLKKDLCSIYQQNALVLFSTTEVD